MQRMTFEIGNERVCLEMTTVERREETPEDSLGERIERLERKLVDMHLYVAALLEDGVDKPSASPLSLSPLPLTRQPRLPPEGAREAVLTSAKVAVRRNAMPVKEEKKRRDVRLPKCVEYDEAGFAEVFHQWKAEFQKRTNQPNAGTTKFAEFLEMHGADVSSYLTGKKRFGKIVLAKMAAAFGVTEREFLAGPGSSLVASTSAAIGEGEKDTGGDGEKRKNTPGKLINLPGKTNGFGEKKKAQKPDKDDEMDPLVKAYCKNCRDNHDGYCEGCGVAKALRLAKRQETPGVITVGAKQGACAGCADFKKQKERAAWNADWEPSGRRRRR